MSDDVDALEVQIQEAKDAGDDAKAQELYQRQQGTPEAEMVEFYLREGGGVHEANVFAGDSAPEGR